MMPILNLENISYRYKNAQGTAVSGITYAFEEGKVYAIVGPSGSGKSTLVQHLNGLIRATSGMVSYNGANIYDKDYDRRQLRSRVGLVFQYPEHQLFEIDVFSDVCFGPKNLGLGKEETQACAREALQLVGIGEEYYAQSPFDLSGGQKRRVAIAGVLAMKPDMLVLDEPTAGLDPRGRDEILGEISQLREKTGMTIVLVSHSMEDVANYVDRIVVMNKGSILFDDTPREVFRHVRTLEEVGLAAPQVTYIMNTLKDAGLKVDTDVTTLKEACANILKAVELPGRKDCREGKTVC